MSEIKEDVIRAYALENAIKYNGKANFGSVLSGLFSQGLKKSQIKEYSSKINEVINETNKLEIETQKKEFEKLKNLINKREERVGLPELPNAKKGKVVMRFAPFPSGAIHLGNSRPLILNDEYAKIYDGKFLLIIDDTIGSEEKPAGAVQPAGHILPACRRRDAGFPGAARAGNPGRRVEPGGNLLQFLL